MYLSHRSIGDHYRSHAFHSYIHVIWSWSQVLMLTISWVLYPWVMRSCYGHTWVMYEVLFHYYNHVFIIYMSFESWSCGVSLHMMLLFVNGRIVCSGSSHFIPTIGISTAWRWHVFRGGIVCSYYFSHTLLALWSAWRCDFMPQTTLWQLGCLASCDEIFLVVATM